jgi:hypothetical protein
MAQRPQEIRSREAISPEAAPPMPSATAARMPFWRMGEWGRNPFTSGSSPSRALTR